MKGSSEGLAPGTLDPYNLPVPLPLKENPEVPGPTLDISTCKLDLLQIRGCKLVRPGSDLPVCLFSFAVLSGRDVQNQLYFFLKCLVDAQCLHLTRKSRFLALLAVLAHKISCYALYSIFFLILIFVWFSIFFFPGGSDGKASVYNAGDPGSIPGLGRFPWRRKWQSTPVLLPGKSHGQRSLVGYSPWGLKESDTTERLHFTSCIIDKVGL